jgi:Putative beta barrel porin-7 (BBP7)
MWRPLPLLLCCAIGLSLGGVFAQDELATGGDAGHLAPVVTGYVPRPEGGYIHESIGNPCPCDMDTYWDLTGGRCPADWAGTWGYGYECHTWNFRAEYLIWFSRGRKTPPLATTVAPNLATDSYGTEPIGENARSGLRLTLGHLLADNETWAEGRFWGLEDSTERYGAISSTTPFILEPFLSRGSQAILVIAAPSQSTGGIDILSKNDLIGGDAWLRRSVSDDGYRRFDLLAGYQFSRLDDSLVISRRSQFLAGNSAGQLAGTIFDSRDSFRTQNEFHGGSLGFISERRGKYWSMELLGKIGLGSMREAVIIDGAQSAQVPGNATTNAARGLLTQPSNIGSYERNRFAVVPELNVNGVLNLSPSWRLMAGYSIIYWSNAVLAGNQIDTRINLTQNPPGPLVGPLRPTFAFNRNDYVVQGMNLGAEYRW